jgi:hypothetical protein
MTDRKHDRKHDGRGDEPDDGSHWQDDSRGAGEADTDTPSEGGADNTDDESGKRGGERADQT